MKLGLVFGFGSLACLVLLAACSSEDSLGSKHGNQNGSGGAAGDNGGPDAGLVCSQPSPVGCVVSGCASGLKCDPSVGCTASACGCDPATGSWVCTSDCSGGVCVPEAADAGLECPGTNPAGCAASGCAEGLQCDTTAGCAPSACGCDPATGSWLCTSDCSGGVCVPVAADAGPSCAGQSPEGCLNTGCPSGQKCDTSAGCAPTACACDQSTGTWTCTSDCSGGTCVDE
jgi:hypothetical protein